MEEDADTVATLMRMPDLPQVVAGLCQLVPGRHYKHKPLMQRQCAIRSEQPSSRTACFMKTKIQQRCL